MGYDRTQACTHCDGGGFEPMGGRFKDSHACSVCGGEGEIRSHFDGDEIALGFDGSDGRPRHWWRYAEQVKTQTQIKLPKEYA